MAMHARAGGPAPSGQNLHHDIRSLYPEGDVASEGAENSHEDQEKNEDGTEEEGDASTSPGPYTSSVPAQADVQKRQRGRPRGSVSRPKPDQPRPEPLPASAPSAFGAPPPHPQPQQQQQQQRAQLGTAGLSLYPQMSAGPDFAQASRMNGFLQYHHPQQQQQQQPLSEMHSEGGGPHMSTLSTAGPRRIAPYPPQHAWESAGTQPDSAAGTSSDRQPDMRGHTGRPAALHARHSDLGPFDLDFSLPFETGLGGASVPHNTRGSIPPPMNNGMLGDVQRYRSGLTGREIDEARHMVLSGPTRVGGHSSTSGSQFASPFDGSLQQHHRHSAPHVQKVPTDSRAQPQYSMMGSVGHVTTVPPALARVSYPALVSHRSAGAAPTGGTTASTASNSNPGPGSSSITRWHTGPTSHSGARDEHSMMRQLTQNSAGEQDVSRQPRQAQPRQQHSNSLAMRNAAGQRYVNPALRRTPYSGPIMSTSHDGTGGFVEARAGQPRVVGAGSYSVAALQATSSMGGTSLASAMTTAPSDTSTSTYERMSSVPSVYSARSLMGRSSPMDD